MHYESAGAERRRGGGMMMIECGACRRTAEPDVIVRPAVVEESPPDMVVDVMCHHCGAVHTRVPKVDA